MQTLGAINCSRLPEFGELLEHWGNDVSCKIHWGYVARTERSSRDGSGIPTRPTAALSGAAPRPDTAAAGLPPTPDPAIRKLQKSVQGYCRHPRWGDLYEYRLAL